MKHYGFFLFIIFQLYHEIGLYSQNPKYVDSLLSVLQTSKDTQRIIVLNKIGNMLIGTFPDSALKLGNEALSLSEKLNYKRGIISTLVLLGNIKESKSEFVEALKFYNMALAVLKKTNDKKGIMHVFCNIGAVYFDKNDYLKALEYFLDALRIAEELKDEAMLAMLLDNIGIVYMRQNNFSKALEYYSQVLKINEKLKDKQRIASNLLNIGFIYYYRYELNDSSHVNLLRAQECFLKSLKIFEDIGNRAKISECLVNVAATYSAQGNLTQALDYYLESLKIQKELGNKKGIATILNNIGDIYMNQRKYSLAQHYLLQGLKVAKEIGLLENMKYIYFTLHELYALQHDYKKAYEYHLLYTQIKDSILNEETMRAITEMQTKYETEKKEKAIQLQKAEITKKNLEIKQKNIQRNAFLVGFVLVMLLSIVIYRGYLQNKRAKKIIETKNKDITESIQYASLIQIAMLPSEEDIKRVFSQAFILYKPKDIVCGDFYWISEKEDKIFFTVADCTGHGVPGALMSMIGIFALNEIVHEKGITKPAEILNELRKKIIHSLKQRGVVGERQDGMDMAFCVIDKKNNILEYAGAYNPLYLVRNNELKEIKADRMPVGIGKEVSFTNHSVQIEKDDSIYIFSDGFQDQFGGEEGKKFTASRLKKTLLSIQAKSMEVQKEILNQTFEQWKGKLYQVDDVCIMGVRV